MHPYGLFSDFKNSNTADIGRGAREVLVNHCLRQTDRFKNLSTAIAHIGRNAHFGHDLHKPLTQGFDIVFDRLLGAHVLRHATSHLAKRLNGQIRMNRLSTITRKQCEVVYLAC